MLSNKLVDARLRKIAETGLSQKNSKGNEEGIGWKIQELNEKLVRRGLVGCEIPIEEPSNAAFMVEGLDIRERDSLLKLIIGMAMGRYKYDPTAKKGDTSSSIVRDVEKLGLAVSDETVRKYLREAARLLERPEKI